MAWNTLYMKPKSPDLGFALFADHLPDSFLKPLEFISLPKSNLRPILGSHRTYLGPQKS